MKVAVACKDGNCVASFGSCEAFAIYDFKGDYSAPKSKTVLSTEGLQGHAARIELLDQNDVAMVLCDGMGPEARKGLLDIPIMPVSGYQGEADRGAVGLMNGEIPLTQSACDSCGGDCSSGHCG